VLKTVSWRYAPYSMCKYSARQFEHPTLVRSWYEVFRVKALWARDHRGVMMENAPSTIATLGELNLDSSQ